MAGFKSIRSYRIFAKEVKRRSRFVRISEAEDFLRAVSDSMHPREVVLPAGKTLWRARVGYERQCRVVQGEEVEEEVPYGPKQMVPLADRAREGRVNPQGIPCLYLATDRETALAEVRPWIGSLVSVGNFKVQRNLRIVDCSWYHKQSGYWHYLLNTPIDELEKDPEPGPLERVAWGDIDHEFSRPVTRNEDAADYVPTQVIAELFKSKGMDGIAYKSALREEGYNVALFDLQAAKIQFCQLLKVDKVEFSFSEHGNPWWRKQD